MSDISTTPEQTKTTRRKRCICWILIAVVVIVIAGVVLYLCVHPRSADGLGLTLALPILSIAGVIVIACELWIAMAASDELRIATLLGAIGVTLAMIGPGSTSLDNLRFGRKRFDVSKR